MPLQGKRILVTGGTGSLGLVLVRQMLAGKCGTPTKVIVFSRDDAKQHAMRSAYANRTVCDDDLVYENARSALDYRIGDVRSYADVCSAVCDVDIVVNAAALKQVATCEYFPAQAMATNCDGPQNIVRAIRAHGYAVETVVGISTDKACKPIGVLGMTKAIQERIFTSANLLVPNTRFVCVRFGNFLASRGSVIPLMLDQIEAGGPVTLTAPEMTRFWLTVDEAAETVLAAVADAGPGETFVPIVPSATMGDLARGLIGDRAIEVDVIGIRPGEKIHEVLIAEEECGRVVRRGDYYSILPLLPELDGDDTLDRVSRAEYTSLEDVLDRARLQTLLERNGLI